MNGKTPSDMLRFLRARTKIAARKMRHSGLKKRLKKLDSPDMRALIDDAARLEPGILFPGGPRKASLPPHAHDAAGLIALGQKLEEAVGWQPVESVVLVSGLHHLSGAARCGMKMAQALAQCAPGSRILLVPTDTPAESMNLPAESEVEVLNLAAIAPASTPSKFRRLLLLDLLRGSGARRVVVANSALGWEVLLQHGHQLRSWMHLYAYMFCWDMDRKGRRKGYPLMEYPRAFSVLDGAFFDANALREEVIERHMLPTSLQQRLVTVHTPMDGENIPDLTHDAGRRFSGAEPLNALWSGRLDMQKRPDLAMHVARKVPRMRLHMYGKPVFGGVRMSRIHRPSNVLAMGSYEHFADLPLRDFDFFLYTSRWDGLPTVIMEAALCGLPIVAPVVGGVGDLLDASTGWPVPDHDDPSSYAATIDEMISAPAEAARRAAEMRKRVLALCNWERYALRICDFLARTTRLGDTSISENTG